MLIAGGILPAMSDIFAASAFRERFEAKGRFDGYMKDIPTRLIVQQYAGLLGAAEVLVSPPQPRPQWPKPPCDRRSWVGCNVLHLRRCVQE